MNSDADLLSAADGLFVVETIDGDAWLGQFAFGDGILTVHSGFVGRPVVVWQEDVLAITPATEHPDVVIPTPRTQA